MITLQKILVPTDFSESSEKAICYGVELATKFGAELHLFHTFEATPLLYGDGVQIPGDIVVEFEAGAVKQLEELEVDGADQLKVIRKVAEGHPFLEIVRYAKDHSIDLIVLGSHGRGAIAHMLLGNVAERVVRKAPCPVLVVRDEQHDFLMP